jgi:serine/threonine-protein kinase
VDEAVKIAREVADALDYAHRNDVLHRDIKPGNILLHDGRPVVADFGIAVAISAAGGGRMTETGLSLGTPHYMSPEQASADRDLNARSDVYSLGCVLYEMIAGQPPHTGPSAQSILVRILTESPRPLTEMRHTVPPHVAAVVAKSIEKLPADRFDTARDFMDALEDVGFTYTPAVREKTTAAAAVSAASAGASPTGRMRLFAGAIVLLAGLAAWGWLRPTPRAPVQRFPLRVGDFVNPGGTPFALSPDGATLAFTPEDGKIYWRALSALDAQAAPESDRSRSPFFSPDGRTIGYTTGPVNDDRIRTLSLDGAPPRTLAGDHFPGAAWGDDGFVYYVDNPGAVYRVSDQGGDPEQLMPGDSSFRLRLPQPLPGGRAVLLHTWDEDPQRVVALDLETRELQEIEEGTHARFAGGYLFWIREGTLFAAPFDPRILELTGQGMEVVDGVRPTLQGSFEYAISETGTLVYQTGGAGAEWASTRVGWLDDDGGVSLVDAIEGSTFADVDRISLSPDERYVAMEIGGEIQRNTAEQLLQIWILDLDQESATRLTFQGERNAVPRWMADGRTLAYVSSQGEGPDGIWMQPFDRSGSDQLLFQAREPITDFDVPPTADLPLVVQTFGGRGVGTDLWLAIPGSGELQPFLNTEFFEHGPRISPDGRWVAYVSNESGQWEVYLRSYPDVGRPWLISRNGGSNPLWSPSGDALYFETPEPNNRLMRARLALGDEVRLLEVEELFSTTGIETNPGGRPGASYDVSGEDGRILATLAPAMAASGVGGEAFVVLNLFEELDARWRR